MSDVVHVSPALFGERGVYGGGERWAFELARAQSEIRPTRFVTFGAAPERLRYGSLQVHVLRARWRPGGDPVNPLSERLLPELATASVVHAHQLISSLTDAVAFICKVLGRRLFVTDLGAVAPDLSRRFDREPVIERHLALSHFAASFHPRLADRTTIVGGGVDEALFDLPPLPREPLVVYVGRLMPYKGADVLLRALPPGIACEIYGRPYDPRYFADLERLAAGKDVTFVKDASDDTVRRAYRRARVVVLPSVPVTMYGESVPNMELFGLTLAEAMATGTPVLSSAAGGMQEVVVDGLTGFTFPAGDHLALRDRLVRLVEGGPEWDRMSAAASDHARRSFGWSDVARRCFAAYEAPATHSVRRALSSAERRQLLRSPTRAGLLRLARGGLTSRLDRRAPR